MLTNKIILTTIGITSFITPPIQLITTFVLGILVSLTFGLLLLPISLVWVVLFLYPLLGLSYVYERVVFSRPFVSIVGIPIAVTGNIYNALMPSMGEMDSRCAKFVICQTFPYTWRFDQFQNHKLDISEGDVLNKILQEVTRAEPLIIGKYLDMLRIEIDLKKDEKYKSAKEVIFKNKNASVGFLMHKLHISFARAFRIIDLLKKDGLIVESKDEKGSSYNEVYNIDEENFIKLGFKRNKEKENEKNY